MARPSAVFDAIALFASSRRNGNTGMFMDRIAAELDIEVLDLASKRMSAYDYAHRNRDDLMKRVLEFGQIIFASPVCWYAVSPPMKISLDRVSDFLDIPELVDDGRRLRGKMAYVVRTSIYEEAPKSFLGAFTDTFHYLGMRFGGIAPANRSGGYDVGKHDGEAKAFARFVKSNAEFERAGLAGSCGVP